MSMHKPAEMEEEYFARQEYLRLKEIEEEKHRKLEEDEKARLKELHYMRCPKCGMNLVTIDYKGIQIDRCSSCIGVWLDQGELEAIAELEHPVKQRLFEKFFKVHEWRNWD